MWGDQHSGTSYQGGYVNLTDLKYFKKTLKLIFLRNTMAKISNLMVSNKLTNTITKTHSGRALTQLYELFYPFLKI